MNWLVVIIVVAIIAGVIGAMSSDDGNRSDGFLGGCLTGGLGCGYVIFNILLIVVGIVITFKIFGFLFG